jgi:hypothetical protein
MLYPTELQAHIFCFLSFSGIEEYHGILRRVHKAAAMLQGRAQTSASLCHSIGRLAQSRSGMPGNQLLGLAVRIPICSSRPVKS